MLITETKHSGKKLVWIAVDEDDFCIKVQQCNPRGDWEPHWSFEQFCSYLAADLQSLEISDQQTKG